MGQKKRTARSLFNVNSNSKEYFSIPSDCFNLAQEEGSPEENLIMATVYYGFFDVGLIKNSINQDRPTASSTTIRDTADKVKFGFKLTKYERTLYLKFRDARDWIIHPESDCEKRPFNFIWCCNAIFDRPQFIIDYAVDYIFDNKY